MLEERKGRASESKYREFEPITVRQASIMPKSQRRKWNRMLRGKCSHSFCEPPRARRTDLATAHGEYHSP